MRLRDKIIIFFSVLAGLSLLITAGLQLDYINSERSRMNIVINDPLENAPPSLAFATVAMGAFRGLVVDILWMRADKLKEQGQFFDAKQLAEWISILQPRFASVWEFQAWNMAYNISVAIPATIPQERWMWVKNGYELLRDRGIELNPKSISLYRELARILQHKVGGITDDVHKYYKLQMAIAMEPLLKSPDNDCIGHEYFAALKKAPEKLSAIAEDANFSPFIKALKEADTEFSDDKKFVSNYLSLRQSPGRFSPEAFQVIENFRGTEALKEFDIFARAFELRNRWKFDPELMDELNRTYGPIDYWRDPNSRLVLDWRHPNCHAIYWAIKGLQVAGEKSTIKDGQIDYSTDETNTDRMVAHSLQNLFRNGKMFIYSEPVELPKGQFDSADGGPVAVLRKQLFLRSDLRMFDSYNNAIIKIIEKYPLESTNRESSHAIGHRNMLKNAIFSFYQAGHMKQAQRIYKMLRSCYDREEFRVPLVVFVKSRLREELQTIGINNATEIIVMMLREAYFRYAMHDDDQAFGREKMAKEIYDHYRKKYSNEDRIDLPDFKLMRYVSLMDFINDASYPVNLRMALRNRIQLERPDLSEQLNRQEELLIEEQQQLQQQ